MTSSTRKKQSSKHPIFQLSAPSTESHLLDDIQDKLEKIEYDLHAIQNQLDNITDPLLIDSLIFDMKANHMRYAYFLSLYKDLKHESDAHVLDLYAN